MERNSRMTAEIQMEIDRVMLQIFETDVMPFVAGTPEIVKLHLRDVLTMMADRCWSLGFQHGRRIESILE